MSLRRKQPLREAREVPLGAQDSEFISSIHAAQLIDKMPYVNWALYLIGLFLITVLIWAAIAHVDVVTRADGRIVPDGREQSIASLEGGILRELHVQEGMQVEAGQIVAQLDPTRVAALQSEGKARQVALMGAIARLQAEVNDTALVFPAQVLPFADVVTGETETYNARQQALKDTLATSKETIDLLSREVKVAQDMAASGLMAKVEVMQLRRQLSNLGQQRQERINQQREQASTQLTAAQNELAQLDEQLVVRDDVLERTVLRSPVHGLVKNIRVATVGGVVSAGIPIMEIVPLGGRVLVEAQIRPADIGFVREGQMAKIRLSAYEYNTYGGLQGIVEYISPDALSNTDKGGATDRTHYRARIRADVSTLRYQGQPLPVRPGMTGTVEISTNDRSVLSFLLRPILKSRDAFRQP